MMEENEPFDEDHWIGEICACNGLDVDKGELEKVNKIELFLSNLPQVPSMTMFRNITILQLVGCNISRMENLHVLENLTELWICEAQILQIENLDYNTMLLKLYLYNNKIRKIENLSHLTKLQTLWLNKNLIQEIEGLETLEDLRELNLSENQIKQIEDSFEYNVNLQELNLAGNLTSSLKDITNLSKLKHLTSLGLKDPMCQLNPIGLLCNFTTFILYHIPTLKRLDSYDVSQKNLKKYAETNIEKKKIFYKLQVKRLERVFTQLQYSVKHELAKLQDVPESCIRKLCYAVKEIEHEIETSKDITVTQPDTDDEPIKSAGLLNDQLTYKLGLLKDRIEHLERLFERFNQNYHEISTQASLVKQRDIMKLQVEFSSGGNICFEEGTNNDVWFNSCFNLIQSRFAYEEFKELKVSGFKLHKITRVHNRTLRAKFDEKMPVVGNVDGHQNGQLALDYLFLADYPSNLQKMLELGFAYNEKERIVKVTNSIQLSDKHRIKYVLQSQNNNAVDKSSFRHGQMFVCKVFLGKSSSVSKEKRPCQALYPECNSVYQTKKHSPLSCRKKLNEMCHCTERRCTWYVFDPAMVLVEYVVDFEYITAVTPALTKFYSSLLCTQRSGDQCYKWEDRQLNIESEENSSTETLLSRPPILPNKPRITFLTGELLLRQTRKTRLSQITELNLHGSGLSKVKLISTLTSLKKLVLSYNDLSAISDLGGMSSLESMDVSFNKIGTLDGTKLFSNLAYLDISWNNFRHTRDEVGLLHKNFPSLKHLYSQHNPWIKTDTLRLRSIGRLRSLKSMNGVDVTESERLTAIRMAASSRVSMATLLANSRTNNNPLRALSLQSTPDTLVAGSLDKPVSLGEDDTEWLAQITCLCLDDQHLSKISNLDKLCNLKWASFNNNYITRIEGLEACLKLEELCLVGNCIKKLEGLNHLVELHTLDISDNYVTSLDSLHLNKLTYLAFDNNIVSNLNGIQELMSLTQVFGGNNDISEMREIYHLKGLTNLIIVDLLGNPFIVDLSLYRLFLVYHLGNLKVLDGTSVETTEGGVANETFGGKLTLDFIAERLGHSNFAELCELDIPDSCLRSVELPCEDVFRNLRSLNLEQNNLVHLGGIFNLVHLKVLCLNHNKIEHLLPRNYHNLCVMEGQKTPVMTNLEVLHLGYNNITNMAGLQLACLPVLKALFLQGNEITRVEGLENLTELRELVLDKNKIKNFHENSFIGQCNLCELHLEENRLRELKHISCLFNLKRLYIGLNRIQTAYDLEKLERLPKLFELSVIGNPVAKKHLHRALLVFRQPNLLCIDGVPVTNDERVDVEMGYIEQQGGVEALQKTASSLEQAFPELAHKQKKLLQVSSFLCNTNATRYWQPSCPYDTMVENTDQHETLEARGKRRFTKSKLPTDKFSHRTNRLR